MKLSEVASASYRFFSYYEIDDYTSNPDGSFDIHGDAIFKKGDFTKLPYTLRNVKGDLKFIDCPDLQTLDGCPVEINGDMVIERCEKLTSYQGGPTKGVDMLSIAQCDEFNSLAGCPDTVEVLACRLCPKLETLAGCPKVIDRCSLIGLKSLVSVSDLRFVNVTIMMQNNLKFKKYLQFLKIKNKTTKFVFNNKVVERILTKHHHEHDIMAAQEDLIDAGFEEYARL
jgi:hypothetical protein